MTDADRTAVVTGASSGIGAAITRRLSADGYRVFAAARRLDRLEALADETGCIPVPCDVTNDTHVAALASTVGDRLDVLVANAGGAKGNAPLVDTSNDHWRWMFEANVMGTVNVVRALLPALEGSGNGLLVTMGSTAGREAYAQGGGYTVAKAGVAIITETLRQELLGRPVRITEISPGMVASEEFGLVRYDGDQSKRDATYAGVPGPLTPDDVAEAVGWVASLPWHMDVDLMVLRPRDQASQYAINRTSD